MGALAIIKLFLQESLEDPETVEEEAAPFASIAEKLDLSLYHAITHALRTQPTGATVLWRLMPCC